MNIKAREEEVVNIYFFCRNKNTLMNCTFTKITKNGTVIQLCDFMRYLFVK